MFILVLIIFIIIYIIANYIRKQSSQSNSSHDYTNSFEKNNYETKKPEKNNTEAGVNELCKEYLTEEMTQALQAITDPQKKIIWIYGKAGTGKSTFLNYIRIKVQPANTVYLAPTGISALLINGQTLHSFFSNRAR